MDEPRRAHHLSAEHLADALMAQADAQQRAGWPQAADHLVRDARVRWIAGAGGDHDVAGTQGLQRVGRDGVIAIDLDFGPQLAEILHEVVGERIVVINHGNHCAAS